MVLCEDAPELPIVFCTAHDANGAKSGLDLDRHTLLVPKPYAEQELLRAVRRAT